MKPTSAKMHIVFQGGKATFLLVTNRTEKEKFEDSLAHIERPVTDCGKLIETYKQTIRYALSHYPLDDAQSILENFAAATVSQFPAHQIIWEIITTPNQEQRDALLDELRTALKAGWRIRRNNKRPPLISEWIKARLRPDDLVAVEEMIAKGELIIAKKKDIYVGGFNKRIYDQTFLEDVALLAEEKKRPPTQAEIGKRLGWTRQEVSRMVAHWCLVLTRGKPGPKQKKRQSLSQGF